MEHRDRRPPQLLPALQANGYAGFLQQAQYLHDWYCSSYSVTGSSSSIGTEHVYMMGMVDWVSDHPTDQAGIAAINRVLAYIKSNLPTAFFETRVSARMLECLCHFKEKLGWANVDSEIATLVAEIRAAPVYNGFISVPQVLRRGERDDRRSARGNDSASSFPKDACSRLRPARRSSRAPPPSTSRASRAPPPSRT